MHVADNSQPTAAVQVAFRQYDEKYGASDSNEEEDVEDGQGDDGGGGSSGGAGSSSSRYLPREAHNVFRQWLDENPGSGAVPTKDEVARMARDASAACGRGITEQQVRIHFDNKYVLLCFSSVNLIALRWHMNLRLVVCERPGGGSLSPWKLTSSTPHWVW